MDEPVSTTGALVAIFQSLRAGIRELRQANLANKHKDAVEQMADLLTDAQDRLAVLQQESIELREENAGLRRQIAEADEWGRRSSRYGRVTTPGGAVVYQSVATPAGQPPDHYVCPSCFENEQIQILQDLRVYSGHFQCPSCETKYPIKPGRRPPRRKVVNRPIR